MELVIPLVAAGWLYLISKQPGRTVAASEAFAPRTAVESFVPRTLTGAVSTDADEYFLDMAGRTVKRGDLTSLNTVPFFGRQKAVGPEMTSQTDQMLDSLSGGGSTYITKSEQAPLFSPGEHVQNPLGSPNNNDFFQSRVNPGTVFNNVKPFQDIKVGPGLDQGYGGGGSGGFNSGMDAREKWLPPTVNELRTVNKPKTEFEGRITGPPQSSVQERGVTTPMEKRLPDRHYTNAPERYFTTCVQEGPTYRSQQMNPDVHRVHDSYVGAAGNSGVENPTQNPLVRQDHRQQFSTPLAVTPATAPVPRSNVENERSSMAVYENNRTTTAPEHAGNIQALISAITAPLTDLLRPSRKENTLVPKRLGNPAPAVQALPLLPSTTALKDPTLFSPYDLGSRPHKTTEGGYEAANYVMQPTTREDHLTAYAGGASMFPKPTSYEAGYNATIETHRANEGRTAGGNSNQFFGYINQTAKPREHFSSMGGGPGAMHPPPPTANTFQTRQPQEYAAVDRNEASLLDAFRQNPYTQSLQSVA